MMMLICCTSCKFLVKSSDKASGLFELWSFGKCVFLDVSELFQPSVHAFKRTKLFVCLTSEINLMPKEQVINDFKGFYHGTIIPAGIVCKKIPCYIYDSTCRWLIVKKAKMI